MSQAELRDRLEVIKAERKAEDEEKRQEQSNLKMNIYHQFRKSIRDQGTLKSRVVVKNMEREAKILKQQKEEELRKKIREEQLIEVQNKISQKKQIKSAEE
ncbi:unnamed protein product (macronuclear) [Paramecium tetraurelia]|uniref:Trichohyalin-plectin-homology domain-containing protein n=1 Tax=Paramecium tetraurelia TaxID=5888 RepID=A0EEW2_PARTE|nr:uncharacterized protein GSPATT00026176001 [Paramecium tetraurelia]CAK93853.1 unnamed protein product [Paramecium tetraurelia]|eukprot:XP_001461226.1 hypothetical protein (macronuclear) [Paramecium tetraurelia strain d4-2]